MKIKHKNTGLLPGLEIKSREDGVWLKFDIPNESSALINLSIIAQQRGHMVGKTISKWLDIYATSK